MREIPLTQGKVALVDDADHDWLNLWPWCYHSQGYACRGRRKTDGPGSSIILMHRVIVGIIPEGLEPDHINGDRLNNQRFNLRLATRSQNNANGPLRKDNTSGYRGVSWSKQAKKWQVWLYVQGRAIYLGLFDDPADGARAYDIAALKHYGEFAHLNEV